ncbi:MAG TPA: hypothetical protein VN707_03790 [Casimicrobiaceae bacterium]|nr:hypothetical protein [Casimicrobiaceae bacterium]
MRSALWSGVVACVLVAGCAAMHPRIEREARQKSCRGSGECIVQVRVDCDRFYGCELSVDYDLLVVEGAGKPTEIVWRLEGDVGARFAANGIAVPSSEFECAARPQTREFACSDKHPEFGIFKYRVNVTVPSSLFGPRGVPSLDPWIVNR